jgi:hypothetical protein
MEPVHVDDDDLLPPHANVAERFELATRPRRPWEPSGCALALEQVSAAVL